MLLSNGSGSTRSGVGSMTAAASACAALTFISALMTSAAASRAPRKTHGGAAAADEAGAADRRGAAAAEDDGAFGQVLARHLERVEQRREHDDRRAVLIVVKHRNADVLQARFDVEAARRGDVLEIDAA